MVWEFIHESRANFLGGREGRYSDLEPPFHFHLQLKNSIVSHLKAIHYTVYSKGAANHSKTLPSPYSLNHFTRTYSTYNIQPHFVDSQQIPGC